MKKLFYLMGAFSALALGACSGEADEPEVTPGLEGDAVKSYVNFSIVSAGSTESRADYEDGTGNEAKISNVVLFFYDASGNAFNVNMGTTNTNYIIFKPTELNSHIDEINTGEYNVEHWFNQSVTLNTATPISTAKVLALVNANIGTGDNEGYVLNFNNIVIPPNASMSSMISAGFQGAYSTDLFVMTSSTYKGTDNKTCTAVDVNVYATPEEAANDVADIYVERIKARVLVRDKEGITDHTYPLTVEQDDLPEDVSKNDLVVKVVGWTTNTEATNTYFFKNLSNAYDFTWTWNDADHHRSYWEDALGSNTYNTQFFPNNIKTAPYVSGGTKTYAYTNPNTSLERTKVLLVTQLLDKNTKAPVSLASWYGNTYKLEDLPTAILGAINANRVWVKKSPEVMDGAAMDAINPDDYRTLSKDDLVFTAGTGNNGEMDKSWRTYVSLKTGTYYKSENGGFGGAGTSFVQITKSDAEKLLGIVDDNGNRLLEGAKIWDSGYAYYFTDIKHFGDTYGVVRNHSYNVQIEGFNGLGTPIYNIETAKIPKPEVPGDDTESFVSVKMNVLSWRIVPVQSVIFGQN